jgi:Flp pilus assembly protein TadG
MTRVAGQTRQDGIATVEFTIVLPLLLLIFLAVAEFGRAFMQYNQLTRAVHDSTRLLATEAIGNASGVVTLDAALMQKARNIVVYGNVNGTGPALLPGLAPGNVTVTNLGNGNFSVLVQYTYQPIIGPSLPDLVQGGSYNTGFTLRAEVVMRALS